MVDHDGGAVESSSCQAVKLSGERGVILGSSGQHSLGWHEHRQQRRQGTNHLCKLVYDASTQWVHRSAAIAAIGQMRSFVKWASTTPQAP